jgi:tRNA-uridine 2-sulfurtransferase
VVALDPATNEVVVGEDSHLWAREAEVEALNLIAIDRVDAPIRVRAKIRYAHESQPATATPLSADRLRLTFDEPQRAVAPGQAAVLYDLDEPDVVVGGGTICRPSRDAE